MSPRSRPPPPFGELKRNLKRATDKHPKVRVAIAADSATQFLGQALRGMAIEIGMAIELFEADYDQIDQQLLDQSSELYAFEPDFIFVWHSSEKLLTRFQKKTPGERAQLADDHIERVRGLVGAVSGRCKAKIIYANMVEYDDAVFGNFALKVAASWPYQVRKLNYLLMELGREHKNLYFLDLDRIARELGVQTLRDSRLAITTSAVLGLEALPLVAQNLVHVIAASTGRILKCLVLDLDNTVWGGVIGDDGMHGIELGDLGMGAAFSQLQRWAKQLQQRGIILAVSSKNEIAVAKEPFEKHPDMALRLDDIAVFQANWENKADNIRHIQSILEIGFDSIVFLDDNPVERDQVRRELPDVRVPELPEDQAEWMPYIRRLNLFETTQYTEEDTSRTQQYQQEATRREVQTTFASEGEFLESLQMKAKVERITDFNTPRIAQLILRSNQFNLRTVRHSEEDVRRMASDADLFPLAISIDDRFGSYGLISVVFLRRIEPDTLFVDTWLMSCRVLKRGVERFVLDEAAAICKANGIRWLVGEYLPTAKNVIVKDHYEKLGFEAWDGRWRLDVSAYEPRSAHFQKVT